MIVIGVAVQMGGERLGSDRLLQEVVVEPAAAIHVQPLAVRLTGARVGAEAKNVPVEVFDLHFENPGVIRGRMPDPCAGNFVLLVERILAVNPNPRAPVSLVALAEKEVAVAAGDGDEEVCELEVHPESEGVDVVVAAGGVTYTKDGRSATEADPRGWMWTRHRV